MRRLFRMVARRKAPVIVGTLLAVALVGTAFASAPGTVLRMGVTNTITGNYLTTLQGTVSSWVFQARNNSTVSTSAALLAYSPFGGVPIDLRAKLGQPPMRVNSNVRVPNLNADRVDYYHASDLGRVARGTGASQAGNGSEQTAAQLTIAAPTQGFVLVSGSASFNGGGVTRCFSTGYLKSSAGQSPNTRTELISQGSLATTYVFPVSAAGTHTFQMQVITGCPTIEDGVITAEFVPFGSTGSSSVLGVSR
jgi:hypothetical protein